MQISLINCSIDTLSLQKGERKREKYIVIHIYKYFLTDDGGLWWRIGQGF